MSTADDNRIEAITLDEATVIARNEEIEQEREVALRDLVEDNLFRPLRASNEGHAGPWEVHLEVIDGMLAWHLKDREGAAAGTIGLGMARMRRLRFVLQGLAARLRSGDRNHRHGPPRDP